ncbi:hypothetical protein [Corynebacterium sp.]|uniref:hypothetical protein n=1 Tax=Corynebacterium sp. TaxID=1720 RepID=UPI002F4295AD
MSNDHPTIREMFSPKYRRARLHIGPFLFMVALTLIVYACSVFIAPGVVTSVLSSGALLLIALTMLARLDDISPKAHGLAWQARRAGCVMAGSAAVGCAAEPLLDMMFGVRMDWPTWKEVVLRWGIALVFLTSPNMPPWHRYILGWYRERSHEG